MTHHVELLKDTDLWVYLNSINKDYAQRALVFLEQINPLLDSIIDFFPYYTRHDAVHGREVIKRIAQIVHPDCLIPNTEKSLTSSEVLLLITSSYAHDLGMAVFPGEENQLRELFGLQVSQDWKTSSRLTQYLRENHSTRGLVYIQEKAQEIGIPQNLVFLLGDMMKAHNLSINEMEFQLGKRVAAEEKEIDLKQLACILCVADSLEYSDTRVIDGILDKLKEQSTYEAQVSYRENMKHISIGDSVAIGKDGRVIFSGTFREPEVMALAHKTIDMTEEWVKQYCDIEENSEIKRLRIKADAFIRNLELPGVTYERLGIRMKKENIINLISSNATWSNDVGIPIRELLQNSVEACRYRNHLTPPSQGYNPNISVIFDREKHQVIVSDNGCGMSRNVILNNFLTVGNSRSEEATYQSHGYNSLARFGIGFWSVFTIAREAIIESSPFELLKPHESAETNTSGYSFSVNIDHFHDYSVFKPINRNPGTTIMLQLKENIELDEVFMSLRNQVYCSTIPIQLEIKNEVYKNLPTSPKSIEEEELFGARSGLAKANDVLVYKWSATKNNVEIVLSIAYRENGGKATFLMKDQINSMSQVLQVFKNKQSVCGFAVPLTIGSLSWDIGRVGEFAVNIIDPKGFRYRLDRRTILPSEEQTVATNVTNQLLHEGYRQFLKSNNVYNPEDIFSLNQQSRLHGGEVVDTYTKDALSVALINYSDLLCFKTFKVEKREAFNTEKAFYYTIETLQKLPNESKFFTCQHYKFNDNRYIEADQLIPFIYDLLAANVEGSPIFVIPPTVEASILFDNCIEAKIHVIDVPAAQGSFQAYLMEIGKTINSDEHPWVITEVTGRWSGTIYEREIISSNRKNQFVFLGRYRLIVKQGSRLAQTIRDYANNGKLFAIAELAKNLQELSNGNIDPELANDWPELI